jgi:hypothetical protein
LDFNREQPGLAQHAMVAKCYALNNVFAKDQIFETMVCFKEDQLFTNNSFPYTIVGNAAAYEGCFRGTLSVEDIENITKSPAYSVEEMLRVLRKLEDDIFGYILLDFGILADKAMLRPEILLRPENLKNVKCYSNARPNESLDKFRFIPYGKLENEYCKMVTFLNTYGETPCIVNPDDNSDDNPHPRAVFDEYTPLRVEMIRPEWKEFIAKLQCVSVSTTPDISPRGGVDMKRPFWSGSAHQKVSVDKTTFFDLFVTLLELSNAQQLMTEDVSRDLSTLLYEKEDRPWNANDVQQALEFFPNLALIKFDRVRQQDQLYLHGHE